MSSSSTKSYYISGRVQGVGFRWFVKTVARDLGLAGWVQNLPDGRVRVVAAGPFEDLITLEAQLREGPPAAIVDNVEITEVLPETVDLKAFSIR